MSDNNEDPYFYPAVLLSCLNCGLDYDPKELEEGYISWTCPRCGWTNQEGELPPGDMPEPVTYKVKYINEDICIVSYPPVLKSDLEPLPEKLQEALIIFFTHPDDLTQNHRDNIGNNLYRKSSAKYAAKAKKNAAKARIIKFLHHTDVSELFPSKAISKKK